MTGRLTRRAIAAGTLIAGASLLTAPRPLRAQGFPSGPIRLVVPFAPGGSTDLTARLVADGLGQRLGVPVVVENRPGAGATTGSQTVADAAPDGQTLVMSNIASHAISPALYGNLRYDPVRSFTHIAMVITNPSVWVVNPRSEIANLADLVRAAKAKPGGLDMASSGAGSSNHLLLVRFSELAGIEHTHIPFRGAGPAMTAVIAGQVPMMSDSLPSAAAHIRQGSVRAIAISSAQRHPAFPDVPTFREQGFDLSSTSWFALSGPAGMPAPVVERLHRETMAVIASPESRQRFAELGGTPGDMTPAQFTTFVAEEVARWAPVVRASGATPAS
ncbi:Bug family tripartite tricarboxylate transporter substrate binding protein [Falsiroseomonas tokyonensis]|uniref:Bug family tripartite tricarboxylate transporter substrate binding protein n=1 Tax=Falsiroseomonas tokyonensis TaxID=430521 RepID=A0ABV7C0N8_9PROT|nr:tripartite tricarboxylate transporter substrate binding protein [Falsiroseomonas tokyonensis]MBU8541359.1 tripartite tricarboxylate transporter substrate binding protein [Falsiroseomonas tokyonensis]